MNILDYDHANTRKIGRIQHAFSAWIGSESAPEEKTIDVFDFLEYCREVDLIDGDAFISHHGNGLVSIPQSDALLFDAGRQEHYEGATRPIEYTFAEFLADFSGNGLTEAIEQYLNDISLTASPGA